MARELKLMVDTRGLAPLRAMVRSLVEALAQIDFEAPEEIDISGDGGVLTFKGSIIARTESGIINEADATVLMCRAIPTPAMPLFVASVQGIVPTIKVRWNGGWPHFYVFPGDGDGETDDPLPVHPEMLTC